MSIAVLPTTRPAPIADDGRQRVAILIPCLNEESTVATVIEAFRHELPKAAIWVIDNGSSDETARVAAAAGARVLREPRMGKGFALRAAFRDIDADIYVLADGDNQLPAETVRDLIKPVVEGRADMVVGSRALVGRTSHSAINDFGNVLFSKLLRVLLGVTVTDVLSGYRAMSRLLVKSLPLASRNFEIEVELTIKTTQHSYRIVEVPVTVRPRPSDTQPHLHVIRDGSRIAWAILLLFRNYRPMAFFGTLGLVFLVLAALVYSMTGGVGMIWFAPAEAVSLLLAIAGLLWLSVGSLASVLGRRFQELESKVDMVTTNGLLTSPETTEPSEPR
jgi:glycosyltransferase involved in cell wall biosynthesis